MQVRLDWKHGLAAKRETNLAGKLTIEDEDSVEGKSLLIPATIYQRHCRNHAGKMPAGLKMCREQHMTYAEIARDLSISEKTVEMYITKALNTIRAELNGFRIIVLLAEFGSYFVKR